MIGPTNTVKTFDLDAALSGERARIVRLCAYLSGDPGAAEDLAQETLLEAWRHAVRLEAPDGYAAWVSAIARNVCLRWRRHVGRETGRHLVACDPAAPERPETRASVTLDFEVELERDELATLLDRAMTLLPPETRQVLVERYVEESSYAEIAYRLGMTEGAVGVRLHRGKLALRRVLSTDLRHDAVAFGIVDPGAVAWRETSIWCPFCGSRQLNGHISDGRDALRLRCPACSSAEDLVRARLPRIVPVKGYKSSVSRLLAHIDGVFRPGAVSGAMPCPYCHTLQPIRRGTPPDASPKWGADSIFMCCSNCGIWEGETWSSLTWSLPEVRRFWRDNPRMRYLPERRIEAEGHAAVVTGFESVAGQARIEVVSSVDTYRVLHVSQAPSSIRTAEDADERRPCP